MEDALAIVGLLVGLVLTVLAASSVARALSWPPPLVLVAVGVVGSLLPWVEDLRPSPEVVLVGLIPPLLYAAARQTSAIDIRAESAAIASLSIGLVLATTLGVGFALHAAVPAIPLAASMALGAIVAPPDAVAAAAITRRAGLPTRAVTVLEGESLFDDATALVALRVSLAAVAGSVTAAGAVGQFVGAAAGAVVVGLVVGFAVSFVRRRVTDSVTDTALSLTAPYLAFLPAEKVHASGVLAVVVVGLVLAHRSPLDQEPTARLVEEATWATIARLLESAVFVLIGFGLRDIVSSLEASAGEVAVSALVVLGVVVVMRPVWIFATSWAARLLPTDASGASWRSLAAVSWAGIRGVVSLAAALALPLDMPQRDLLIVLAVVVILGTLGIQGLSLPWVIRRLGIEAPDPHHEALQRAHALDRAAQAGLDRLHEVTADAPVPEEILDALRRVAQERAVANWAPTDDGGAGESPPSAYRRVRRDMMAAERAALLRLRDEGEIDDAILRALQRELDLEDALLAAFQQSDTSQETTDP